VIFLRELLRAKKEYSVISQWAFEIQVFLIKLIVLEALLWWKLCYFSLSSPEISFAALVFFFFVIKLYCAILISFFIFSCICVCVDYKLYRIYVCSVVVGFCTKFVISIEFKGVFVWGAMSSCKEQVYCIVLDWTVYSLVNFFACRQRDSM